MGWLWHWHCTTDVLRAISADFTHVDYAQLYANEDYVGAAISRSGVPREQFFVMTKLGPLKPGEIVEASLCAGLEKLKLS